MVAGKISLREKFVIAGLCLFCLVLCSVYITHLGISPDEADHGFWASELIERIRMLFGIQPRPEQYWVFGSDFFMSHLPFSDVPIPVMTIYFTGAAMIYFIAPFVFLLGENVFALRIGFVLAGCGILLCSHLLCRRFFGRTAALVTSLLLLSNSVFLRTIRIGVEREETIQVFLFLLGLVFFCTRDKKAIWSFLGAFCWGLGLWAKMMFAGYLLGMAAGFFTLASDEKSFVFERLAGNRKRLLCTVCGFMLGALGLAVYFFSTGFEAVFTGIKTLGTTTAYGSDNLNVLLNLKTRVLQLADLLMSKNIVSDSIPTPVNYASLVVKTVCFCIVFVSMFFRRGKGRHEADIRGFVVVLYLVMFCLSVFVPTFMQPEHLFVMFPFFELCTGIVAAWIWHRRAKFVFSATGFLMAACVFAPELLVDTVYFYGVKHYMGSEKYFSGMHECRRFIRANDIQPIVFFHHNHLGSNLSWGLEQDSSTMQLYRRYVKPFKGRASVLPLEYGELNLDRFFVLIENSDNSLEDGPRLVGMIRDDPGMSIERVRVFSAPNDDYDWTLYEVRSSALGADPGWLKWLFEHRFFSWFPISDYMVPGDIARMCMQKGRSGSKGWTVAFDDG